MNVQNSGATTPNTEISSDDLLFPGEGPRRFLRSYWRGRSSVLRARAIASKPFVVEPTHDRFEDASSGLL